MTDNSGTPTPIRLLVLAPNWLGDAVMTTPLLSFLNGHRTTVSETSGRPLEICLGIRPAWADLFREDTRIDELMVMERGGSHSGPLGAMRLAKVLKGGRFDAVLLGPPSLRIALAARLSGIPCRVGYRADGRSLLLSHGVVPLARGDRHYSREMVHLGQVWLESLGLSGPFDLDAFGSSSLPGCDSLSSADTGAEGPVWAVAPGTTYGEAKTWPLSRLAEFIRLAGSQAQVRFVFLGDDAARGFVTQLKEEVSGDWSEELESGALVDLTGKTDLKAAVAVLKASSAFVGNDSGLMHLSAALGIPTVGVFGSSNPDWTAPLGDKTRAVFPDGFDCRPCYRKTCNQQTFCLDSVSAGTVLEAVLELTSDDKAMRGGV